MFEKLDLFPRLILCVFLIKTNYQFPISTPLKTFVRKWFP